jgi:hypothetical protein
MSNPPPMTTNLLAAIALGCGLFSSASRAQVSPRSNLLAHFAFNGDAKDDTGLNPDFELKATTFVDDTIYLNGRYRNLTDDGHRPGGPGYRAIGHISELDYRTFSVMLRFKLETPPEGAGQPNLLTAGTNYRWFGLRFSDADGGKIIVYFDNGDFAARVEGSRIRPEVWTVIACAVDLPNHRVIVYQDGKNVGTIDLPRDFVLDVLNADNADKAWSFTNYSNAGVFRGWVDDFALYGTVLSDEDLTKLTTHRQQ